MVNGERRKSKPKLANIFTLQRVVYVNGKANECVGRIFMSVRVLCECACGCGCGCALLWCRDFDIRHAFNFFGKLPRVFRGWKSQGGSFLESQNLGC